MAPASVPRVALYRGRFDPPGMHHQEVIRALLAAFDKVVVMPWGPQPGRPIDQHIPPVFRAALVDRAFFPLAGPDRLAVDLRDLENAVISDGAKLEAESHHLKGKQVFHVLEAEAFARERPRLPAEARVVVVVAKGQVAPPDGFEHRIDIGEDVPGAVMRSRLFDGASIDHLVPAAVSATIARHGLYRSTQPHRAVSAVVGEPRLLLSFDERNEKAVRYAKQFKRWAVEADEQPNLILVVGGDGSMLHAIQQHWRRRVPFLGVNAGHLGFLLNDASELLDETDAERAALLWQKELVFRHLPMLFVELRRNDGTWHRGLTFNDAWVERATGQSAWVQVSISGRVRLEKLICDGVLVATAAGSTAYARSMGATPLLADTPAWLLVGSNVMEPPNWKSALLSVDAEVEVRSLDVHK
jgi:NAD+ kinase